jgi:signal transduction histidine kinase/ActR/RegA family two-component response regulator
MTAGLTYLLMLCSLGVGSSAFTEHPALMWTASLAISMTVAFRFIIHRHHQEIYTFSPSLWRYLSRGCTLLASCCCGFLYARFVTLYRYEQWAFVLMMVWLTGMLAGALVTLMADQTLMRLYGLFVLAPPMAASLYIGGAKGYCYAFTMLIYMIFMFAQGTYIHNIYWQQMVGRELEAERNEELEQARKTAEQASQAKSRFLAHMSHEIRTPLHGVLGVTDLLARTDLTVEQRELLNVLNTSAEGLISVINDILDLSKVEAGRLALEFIPADLGRLAREAVSILQSRATAKHLRLTATIDESLPPLLLCDPVRLRQVLINLLGNAIKFTSEGSVDLRISVLEGAEAWQNRVHFSVTDTGIGIPQDKHEVIFDAFAQADATTHRHFGGTGLGLAISSQIVKIMGSQLQVSSEPGKGSRFSFTCDLDRATVLPEKMQPTQPVSAAGRTFHILVAEDNPVNQLIVKKTLSDEGHTVVIANNGQEAVDAALVTDFDLVLMDNQMPELNGLEAARIIKAWRPGMPIIGVSASAMQGDRERFLKAGMDGYVSKPFRLQDLLTAIENCMELNAA